MIENTPRTCLIINPTAGRKVGLTTNPLGLDDARALLERHGIEAEIFCTERAGHGTALAQQAVRDGFRRVIAAGGDGTVAEVAEGLVNTNAVLGVLPLGSIMNVARMLGIPRDLDEAAQVIKSERVARIDVGKARSQAKSQLFLEGAGIGIDAGLFTYFNQLDRGNWRSLKPLLTFMWRYRPRRLTVRLDGKPRRYRAMMVTVANGPYLGAALTLAPDARLDDHRFDVQIFTGFGKLELLRHFWAISGGRRVYNPKVLSFRARTVEIEPRQPMMIHADSQPLGTTPARIELLPSALAVIVGGDPSCLPALNRQPAEPTATVGSVAAAHAEPTAVAS